MSTSINTRPLSKITLPLVAILVAIVAVLTRSIHDSTLPSFEVHDHADGIVLLTGTSSGIGHATALHLATRYPQLTFFCGVRKVEDGERLVRSYKDSLLLSNETASTTADNIRPVILDVTKDATVRDVIAKIEESNKPLIGLINNAGVSKKAQTIEFGPLEEYQFHFDVNVFGVYRLTQAALPLLRKARGRIVLMSSIYGRAAVARIAAYSGSKYALEAFGDALRREVSPLGVSVSIVEPGFLPSEITDKQLEAERAMQECEGGAKAECRTYPHLYNEDVLQKAEVVLANVGKMEETCEAMEHAMFARRPKSRYVTSRVGPMPAWLFVRIAWLLPDHIFDML